MDFLSQPLRRMVSGTTLGCAVVLAISLIVALVDAAPIPVIAWMAFMLSVPVILLMSGIGSVVERLIPGELRSKSLVGGMTGLALLWLVISGESPVDAFSGSFAHAAAWATSAGLMFIMVPLIAAELMTQRHGKSINIGLFFLGVGTVIWRLLRPTEVASTDVLNTLPKLHDYSIVVLLWFVGGLAALYGTRLKRFPIWLLAPIIGTLLYFGWHSDSALKDPALRFALEQRGRTAVMLSTFRFLDPGHHSNLDEDEAHIVTPAIERAPASSKDAGAAEELTFKRPKNLVFITVDTLRAELGYAGYNRDISPNIDRLAEKSLVFDNAYSLASYTGKSIGPLLIGKYPSETHRGWHHFNQYGPPDILLQKRLKDSGFYNVSVQGYWYFGKPSGFDRDFDIVDLSSQPKEAKVEGDRTINGDLIASRAIERFASRDRAKPFFMWVHFMDPHQEYMPHEGIDFGSSPRDKYDGEVAFVDQQIGRLLDVIREESEGETAIVITSDHGEAFGEHGLSAHGRELWEELVRVPWIVFSPNLKSAHVKSRVSHVDLVPTLLDLLGVQAEDGELSGQSLLHAAEKPETLSKSIFIDMPAGPYNSDRQAYIEGDLKLITTKGAPVGLYNLASDPGEKNNLLSVSTKTESIYLNFTKFREELKTVYVKAQ